ncbi:MAG TPA: MBL fold metallo-hydrolase [Anaerolineae bacterium]|nr:MBL fold metallo-hydrolase [Anaerolineae bacterium]
MQAPAVPGIRIHYLGHAAFILSFDSGVTVLMDYGQSRAYGLDSPIGDLGDFQPTVVTYSHHHADHDRGQSFAGAQILNGENLVLEDVTFQAIAVSENAIGDNVGYLITCHGLTVFHAGDSQGDIANVGEATVRQRLRQSLPGRVDLLLFPIGWTRDITSQAETYLDFLHPRRAIPMHYWSADEKQNFLATLRATGKNYKITETGAGCYELTAAPPHDAIEIISLTATPYGETSEAAPCP